MAIQKVKLSDNNVQYTKSINANFSELDTNKVDKVEGKGLSTNDLTDILLTKLNNIAENADVNVIETVKVNGTALTPDAQKAVNIQVITDADIPNNSVVSAMKTKLDNIEADADVNVIETVKVNGTALTPDANKAVDITIPTTEGINTLIDTKLADYDTSEEVDTKLSEYTKTDDLTTLLNNKVDKVTGKQLSTEDYTTDEKTKLSGIEAGAEVNVIETVKVNGTALTPDANKAVDVVIPAASVYGIKEQATAESGYAKTYYLDKDGAQAGVKINIPKDLVVSKGSVKTVTTADQPYDGAVVGDKYIDLELNDSTKDHIYIPVKDLVDVYTEGNGIDVSASNVISVQIDATNANGLSVGTNGIALAAATTTTGGAMSAADKAKLEAVEADADVNVIETVKVNGTALTPDSNKAVDVTVPTKIFSKVKVGATEIEADSATDTLELAAGTNVTLTPDAENDKVTIGVTIPEATFIQVASFTSSDAGWGAIDADGNYTLTIANSGKPVVVKKIATAGGYESCMANLRNDGTNFYITSDEKFDGQVYYFE